MVRPRLVLALRVALALALPVALAVPAVAWPGASAVALPEGSPDAPAATAAATAAGGACFPGEGSRFTIGTEGPQILLVVHTSLFSNLTEPGAVGIEAVGTAVGYEIVTLRTGVRFDGGSVLGDPFSAFAVAFYYRFQLPMLAVATGSDFSYEQDGLPFTGPVREADCSF